MFANIDLEFSKLGNKCSFISRGKTPEYDENGTYKIVKSAQVQPDDIRWKDCPAVSKKFADKYSEKFSLCLGDVLLNGTGTGTLGRPAIVHSIPSKKYIVDSHVNLLRVDPEKLDPFYLFYWLLSNRGQHQINRLYTGSTNQIELSAERVSSITIPDMELPDQKRIARILAKCDRLRRLRRYTQQLSDTYLQSVFLEMFGDPVTNPKNWAVAQFSQLVKGDIRNGLSPSNKGIFPGQVLTLSAITQGKFDITARRNAEFDANLPIDKRIRKADFLICRGNGNLNLVGCGRFPDGDYEEILFPDTMIAAPINFSIINREYLEILWNGSSVRQQIESLASTTNGTLKINQKILNNTRILLPDIDLQEKFAAIVQKYDRIRAQQREATRQAEHLFQTNLHRAFRGEL